MDLDTILQNLLKLEPLTQVLISTPEERERLQAEVSAYGERFIQSLDSVKGYQVKPLGDLKITGEKNELSTLLDLYQSQVAETGINAASPRHLGYIPGGGLYSAALADYVAAVTNPFASVYYASPGAATIENEVIDWIKSVFSFPESAKGCLCSGGSVSTLVAFTAARDHHGIKRDKIEKSVVYLSEQVHHSTQKALRLIGLEDVILREIPLDEKHRMQPQALQQQIDNDLKIGLNPFMVVATAGTTDTGAIDPLEAIEKITHEKKLWFHVDAAYGGFFILSSKKDLFKGIEKADSLIVDPHKGLFIPYGVGAVLVKDASSILKSHYYTANYMQDGQNESLLESPANLSPELTKHFRGLRVWLPLQLHGVQPFIDTLEEKLLLTHYFRAKLKALGFELGPEPELSVSYFWYPFKENPEQKNRELMDKIHQDGRVFLSSSVIGGKFVIRMAILSFRTKKETLDLAVEMIEEALSTIPN